METLQIDSYVIDTLMRDLVGHDRQPSAFLVYLFLWRAALERDGKVTIALREIAENTGLSKRAVQDGITRLHQRKLIGIARDSITAVPEYMVYRPWVRR